MIRITNFTNSKQYPADAIYAIVRSYKQPIPGVKQLAVLSPQSDLFRTYLTLRDHGQWNRTAFNNIYAPQFIADLLAHRPALDCLNDLYNRSKRGENITLCCYCGDEDLCHRSIIAGLLQGVGAEVITQRNADYSMYWTKFQEFKKQFRL